MYAQRTFPAPAPKPPIHGGQLIVVFCLGPSTGIGGEGRGGSPNNPILLDVTTLMVRQKGCKSFTSRIAFSFVTLNWVENGSPGFNKRSGSTETFGRNNA